MLFLEIGVSRGGSLQMWQRYFGPYAKILGIDIKPKCKEFEQQGIFVRIGDQSDEGFLAELVEEFGVPDIVLDDGSHVMEHANTTFDFLYPKMGKNGIYMVEDMHCAYWEDYGGGVNNPETFINRSKDFIDQINARHSRGEIEESDISNNTLGIFFYDSIVVFEKGDIFWKDIIRTQKPGLLRG